MKQVYKYDSAGNYVEPVLIDDNASIPKSCTDKPLPQPNWKPVFKNGVWVETVKTVDLLTPAKIAKISELETKCDSAIVNGFDYSVNGVSYRFSCSLAAQANFQGADALFKDGTISEVEWTVTNNTSGVVERISFGVDIFNELKLQVFNHINSNVSKLRNTLQLRVEGATTQSELDAIVW